MPAKLDITGRVFNQLTVIRHVGTVNHVLMWLVRCVCGKEFEVPSRRIRSGTKKSCGCHSRINNLTGRRYGRLLMIREVTGSEGLARRWLAKCDCGKEVKVYGHSVAAGHTISCGCWGREKRILALTTHGAGATDASPGLKRTYSIWAGMRTRCYNVSGERYSRYGGRGIRVCAAWRDSFEAFLTDMGEAPEGLSIDRKDNDKGYTPDNCRWATASEQAVNRSTTHMVSTSCGPMCVTAAVARFSNITVSAVYARIRSGWTVEDAIYKPAYARKGTAK